MSPFRIFSLLLFSASALLDADESLTLVGTSQIDSPSLKQQQSAPQPLSPKLDRVDEWGLYVIGDFLYFQTRENGLEYGCVTRNSVNPDTQALDGNFGAKGDWKNLQPGYNPGFRVGLGYETPYDNWDVQLTWMRYTNSTDSSIRSLPPPVGNVREFIVSPLLNGVGNPLVLGSAKADWDIKLNCIDLSLGRQFFAGKYLVLQPYADLRGAWIEQKIHVLYNDIFYNNVAQPTPFIDVRILDKFWGVGLVGGIDSEWRLGQGVYVFGNFSSGILWSSLRLKHKETIIGNFVRANLREYLHDLNLVANASAGLAWSSTFCKDRCFINLHAGWEEQFWLNVTQLVRFVETPSQIFFREQDNLGLGGLVLGADFGF